MAGAAVAIARQAACPAHGLKPNLAGTGHTPVAAGVEGGGLDVGCNPECLARTT
jgi:hypothetical protein